MSVSDSVAVLTPIWQAISAVSATFTSLAKSKGPPPYICLALFFVLVSAFAGYGPMPPQAFQQNRHRPNVSCLRLRRLSHAMGRVRSKSADHERQPQSLLNKGYALSALSRSEEALTAYDEAILHPGEIDKPSILALVAHALVKKGLTLVDLKRSEEALASYDEAIRRYETNRESSVLGLVAQSFLNKGAVFDSLGRHEEALEACDEVVRRYGGNETLGIRETVAKALVNKAMLLLVMTRWKEAFFVCDEVVKRFGEHDAPILVHMTVDALFLKGGALLELKRPNEALAAFDEALHRSEGAEKTAIPELVAKALVGRGRAFDRLNRSDEALAAYDEVEHRFGKEMEPVFEHLIATALANKVSILSFSNRREEALATHQELARRMGEETPEYHELIEHSLLEKADFELVCGRHASALKTVDQVLEPSCPESLENRLWAYFIRAKAALAGGDISGCERDIEMILTVLPDLDNLPQEHLHVLMEFSIRLGPARMRELIEVSASAYLLLPLMTALAQETGERLRVAREVEEVAWDIRKELESLRKSLGDGNRQTDDDEHTRAQPRTSGIIISDKKNRALPIRESPVRLAVVGKRGEKSNSWKIWMEKDGEIYFSIREKDPGFKVSLHKSGKQHIKVGDKYWGQWLEPDIYAGSMIATSAKLVFPAWGMREVEKMSEGEKETWEGNEIEIDAPGEGRLIALSVVIRVKGQNLKQEDGRSETLAVWHREDGKEAHLIVSEEAERNFKDIVKKTLTNKAVLQNLNKRIGNEVWEHDKMMTATLAGPANEGGNYFLSVSTTIHAKEGKHGKEFIPIVSGVDV